MANDNTLNFELKFKKVCKKISTEKPKNRQEIIDILHANFEDSKIFPDDSIEIQIRHHKFPVWYRLEEPFEIPINGRVKVIILKEKLPINIIQGEIPDIVFTGPFDFTKTVKLRGLPWESDENHIKSFFEGLIIQNDGVYIIYNGDIVKKHSGLTPYIVNIVFRTKLFLLHILKILYAKLLKLNFCFCKNNF